MDNDRIYNGLSIYASRDEIINACVSDGLTPAAAEAFADELREDLEFARQQEGEIAAENAWLIHAENAYPHEYEAERDYERSLGVTEFGEDYRA